MDNKNSSPSKKIMPSELFSAIQLVKMDAEYYFELPDELKNNIVVAIETIKKSSSIYPKFNDNLKRNPKVILNAISNKQNLEHISIDYLKDHSDTFLYNLTESNPLVFKKIINDEYFNLRPNGIMKLSNILSSSINNGDIHLFTSFLENLYASNHKSSDMLNHMIKNVTLGLLDKFETGVFFDRHTYDVDEVDFQNFKNTNSKSILNHVFSLIPKEIKDDLYAKEISKIFPNISQLFPPKTTQKNSVNNSLFFKTI